MYDSGISRRRIIRILYGLGFRQDEIQIMIDEIGVEELLGLSINYKMQLLEDKKYVVSENGILQIISRATI